MKRSNSARSVTTFGGFTFDARTGELSGPAGVQRLARQPGKLLELLSSRPGELVAHDEIRRWIWRDAHVAFDQGIKHCVRQLRSALGDSAQEPRFIETLPGRGYRFIGAAAARPGRLRRRASYVAAALAIALAGHAVGETRLHDELVATVHGVLGHDAESCPVHRLMP